MGVLPRLLACSWSAHSSGPLLEYAWRGESRNPAPVPCPPLVHPLLRVSAGIRLRERGGVLPRSLARPWSIRCSGPLLEYACGGEQESCPGPLPAHYSGPLLEYACTHHVFDQQVSRGEGD